jgi:hypothetical protein
MLTRHSLLAVAALFAFVPALAQNATESAPFWPSPMRATGAYPVRQEASQLLGSNLIGAKVVSATSESVGRIANLVINNDGAVEAAVISIPGMFGITGKNVAVTYKSLNIVRNQAGDAIDHVAIAATKNDLRQAAEFKPLSRQRTEVARQEQTVAPTPVKLTTPPL